MPSDARVAAFVATAILLGAAPAAASWSAPESVFSNASDIAFTAAGDATGKAFIVTSGAPPDQPLVIAQRLPEAISGQPSSFYWSGSAPLDASPQPFTSTARGRSAFRSAAAGDGAAVIAFRILTSKGDELAALTRGPSENFSPAQRVVPATGWITDPSVSVSRRGAMVLAFGAQRSVPLALRPVTVNTGRVTVMLRLGGNPWTGPRAVTSSSVASPITAIGDDDQELLAWLRGTKLEAMVMTDQGRPGPTLSIGRSRTGSHPAIAAGRSGKAALAWVTATRGIAVAYRSGDRFGKAHVVQAPGVAAIKGLSVAIDLFGRTFITWRSDQAGASEIHVAQGLPGKPFTVTSLGSGNNVEDPALTTRPLGGALVSWRAPSGWQTAVAPKTGVFTTATSISPPLGPGDDTLRVPVVFAGPAKEVHVVWRQTIRVDPDPGLVIESGTDEDPQ